MKDAKLKLDALAVFCLTVGTWALIVPGVLPAGEAENNSHAKSIGYAGSMSCGSVTRDSTSSGPPPAMGWPCSPTPLTLPEELTPQAKEVKIGKSSYRADIAGETGWILEKAPKGQKKI